MKQFKYISLYNQSEYEDNHSDDLEEITEYAKEECLKHGTVEHIYQLIRIVSHVRVEAQVKDIAL